jgi:hypothetical protein
MMWCLMKCDLFGTEKNTNMIRLDAFSTTAYICKDLKALSGMQARFCPNITLDGDDLFHASFLLIPRDERSGRPFHGSAVCCNE